jgi:HPt (histidine-containing phosphotransfer) domain-containing protein
MSPAPSLARESDESTTTIRVDASVLTRLATLGRETGTDLLNDVIDLFVDNAGAYHAAFDEDLEREDRVHLKQLAHRLRGSAYNLGASRLAELCHVLENQAETAVLSDVALHIISLKREIDAVAVVLRRDWRTPRHWQHESDEPLWRW